MKILWTRLLLAVIPIVGTLGLSACPYIFSVDNRPCTVQGECLPGYTCVDKLCVKASDKNIGESCRSTAECVNGALCADAYCDDSAQASCAKAEDCGGSDGSYDCIGNTCICARVCRATCDYPSFANCKLGELCWSENEALQGFCQNGNCGETADRENLGACLDSEVCLEFNGGGSGLCNPMCDVLMQDPCANGNAPEGSLCCSAGQNCEHLVKLWGASMNPGNYYGICFDSGTQNEAAPCSNSVDDNLFCTRGLFCLNGGCVRYCNLESPGAAPACGSGQLCINIPGAPNLPYGYCQAQ